MIQDMAGGNEAQRSDRLDQPRNTAFIFFIRMIRQFHVVTALRSRLTCFVVAVILQ
jgi:hypothetical protein